MKKLLVFLLLCTLCFSLTGQENNPAATSGTVASGVSTSWNDMPFLTGVFKARFVLDLSDALINGIEAADFPEIEPEWENGVKEMKLKFMSAFNNEAAKGIHPIRIGLNTEAPLTFFLVVTTVTEDGSLVNGIFEVRDSDNTLLFSKAVWAEKGHHGSVPNLMGDALEEMGEMIGRKLSGNVEVEIPVIDDQDIRNSIKAIVSNGESISINLKIAHNCAAQLLGKSYIKVVDAVQISELSSIFIDSFRKALSKSTGKTISEKEVFLGESNPGGAQITITLDSLYGRMDGGFHNTFIAYVIIINTQDGQVISGVTENGEVTTIKNFMVKQMEDLGKKMGRFK